MNPLVEEGQLWKSRDPRDYDRGLLKVLSVNGQKVIVENTKTKRKTTISLRRLRLSLGYRGYYLVQKEGQ